MKTGVFVLAEKERFLRRAMQLHTALRASSVALCSAVAGKTVSQTVFLLPFESLRSK